MAIVEQAKEVFSTKEDGRGYLDALTNKYIIKPKTAEGIGGFVFDFDGEASVVHQADITDHFAEDNTVINDHIARRPARVSLRGFVAELVFKKPAALTGALNTLQNKLTTVPAYLGDYTPGALAKIQKSVTQAQNAVNTINQKVARAQNIVGFFSKSAQGDTKQRQAYTKLFALFERGEIFTVETPFAYYDRMVIEGLSFIQPEDTKFWSDITISLKQVRFVEVQAATANADSLGGRSFFQKQPNVDQGRTKGQEVPTSALYNGLTSAFPSLAGS